MGRFFLEQDLSCSDFFEISGADFHHLKDVLRAEAGTKVEVCDQCGFDYLGIIEEIGRGSLRCRILSRCENTREFPLDIILCQALAKGDKMDRLIRQSVELGVTEIAAFSSDHCQIRAENEKLSKKVARWQGISESAAKQSGRGCIPKVNALASFKEAAELLCTCDVSFMPYEGERTLFLWQFLQENGMREKTKNGKRLRCAFVIGPEGGFSAAECALAQEKGIASVSLGPRILRTETAGPAVLAQLSAYYEAH